MKLMKNSFLLQEKKSSKSSRMLNLKRRCALSSSLLKLSKKTKLTWLARGIFTSLRVTR